MQPTDEPTDVSAPAQVFAIPELFALIMQHLTPPPKLLEPDVSAVDIYIARAYRAHLNDLLRAQRVSRHWRNSILHDRSLCEALFLAPHWSGHGRAWDVPPDAPWLALNRAIVSFEPQRVLRRASPSSASRQSRNDRDEEVASALLANHEISIRPLGVPNGEHHTGSRSLRIRKRIKYTGRPVLNPLLQWYFKYTCFDFYVLSQSPNKRQYTARFTFKFDRSISEDPLAIAPLPPTWANCPSNADPTMPSGVPSWCHMQLASPPVKEVLMTPGITNIACEPQTMYDEGGITMGALYLGVKTLSEATGAAVVRVHTL